MEIELILFEAKAMDLSWQRAGSEVQVRDLQDGFRVIEGADRPQRAAASGHHARRSSSRLEPRKLETAMSLMEDIKGSFQKKGLEFVSLIEAADNRDKSILTYKDASGTLVDQDG